jgi:hypothetical protein
MGKGINVVATLKRSRCCRCSRPLGGVPTPLASVLDLPQQVMQMLRAAFT